MYADCAAVYVHVCQLSDGACTSLPMYMPFTTIPHVTCGPQINKPSIFTRAGDSVPNLKHHMTTLEAEHKTLIAHSVSIGGFFLLAGLWYCVRYCCHRSSPDSLTAASTGPARHQHH